MNGMMMKRAFTLAEVLVTLMVIGVVAALTIPTLLGATEEAQIRVGYKKAISVIGQAAELMKAKEVQCRVTNSEELAQCFQSHTLSGFVTDNNGETTGYQNVLVTPDGLSYQFLYNDTDYPVSYAERTIDQICGDFSDMKRVVENNSVALAAFYTGKTARCVVVADVNGFKKGTTHFPRVENTSGMDSTHANEAVPPEYIDLYYGDEQLPMIVTGTGVRPVFNTIYPVGEKSNKGYSILYGTGNPITGQVNPVRQ